MRLGRCKRIFFAGTNTKLWYPRGGSGTKNLNWLFKVGGWLVAVLLLLLVLLFVLRCFTFVVTLFCFAFTCFAFVLLWLLIYFYFAFTLFFHFLCLCFSFSFLLLLLGHRHELDAVWTERLHPEKWVYVCFAFSLLCFCFYFAFPFVTFAFVTSQQVSWRCCQHWWHGRKKDILFLNAPCHQKGVRALSPRKAECNFLCTCVFCFKFWSVFFVLSFAAQEERPC